MDRSEQALASLLGEDESLLETWTADTINRGFELSPPGMGGSETLGLTDRRLVWLDDDLETVDLGDVVSVETNSVSRTPGSTLALIGPVLLVLGAIATVALWLLSSFSVGVVLAPLGIGALVFLLGLLSTRLRDPDDVDRQYYLEVKTMETTLQVYAMESTVESMDDRLSDAVE